MHQFPAAHVAMFTQNHNVSKTNIYTSFHAWGSQRRHKDAWQARRRLLVNLRERYKQWEQKANQEGSAVKTFVPPRPEKSVLANVLFRAPLRFRILESRPKGKQRDL